MRCSYHTRDELTYSVAAAFTAAQNNTLPMPTSAIPSRAPKPPSSSSLKPQSYSRNIARARSPAEQLASAARALSPVRYFLQQNPNADESAEYPSFSSLGSKANSSGQTAASGNSSYDFRAEEAYVQAAQSSNLNGHRRPSKSKGKENGDAPYRPFEDIEVLDLGDSEGEGEGIVKAGALQGRAGTRGKRSDKGEGYLGMGLGIHPRTKRRGRASDGMDGSEDETEDADTGPSDFDHSLETSHLPPAFRKSPTPREFLRALSPPGTAPPPISPVVARSRRPSAGRTILTNLLEAVAMTLRAIVQLIASILTTLIARPIQFVLRSGKEIGRQAKRDGWKWLLGLLVLSLAIRLAQVPWRPNSTFDVPDMPPKTMNDMIRRLTSLEQTVSTLSATSSDLKVADRVAKSSSQSILERIGDLEGSLIRDVSRLEDGLSEEEQEVKNIHDKLDNLRRDVDKLSTRPSTLGKVDQHDIQNLRVDLMRLEQRVGKTETDLRDGLDEKRLLALLERTLPLQMPVKHNSRGSADIDPSFWIELKKVFATKADVESSLGKVYHPQNGVSGAPPDLEAWADRLFQQKAAMGVIVSRDEFLKILEAELADVRHRLEALPSKAHQPIQSITVKSSKGEDMTSTLQALIDAALLRYSKDTIARPDYALFSSGARVVPSLTTDTMVLHRPNVLARLMLGRKTTEGRPPATVLHPDNAVGSCWPFAGGQGQLGVMLSRRIVVSDITLEHAAEEVALDVASAPKEIEVVRVYPFVLDSDDDTAVGRSGGCGEQGSYRGIHASSDAYPVSRF